MKLVTIATFVLVLVPMSVAAQAPMKQGGDMAMESAKPPVPPSKSVNVTFDGKTIKLTVDDLLNLPQVTVHVHNAHHNTEETYSGPLLADVLARALKAGATDAGAANLAFEPRRHRHRPLLCPLLSGRGRTQFQHWPGHSRNNEVRVA